MKAYATTLFATLLACSRVDAPAAHRHEEAEVRVRTPAHEEASSASDDREPAHQFPLPKEFGYMMTPGQEPSPMHSAGTVYMIGRSTGASLPIGEWDLASEKLVHRVWVPVATEEPVKLVHEGGILHLVTGGFSLTRSYIRLSPELKVLTRTRFEDLGDANTVAGDADVSVVTSCRWFYDTAGPCFVATYDRRGARIASRAMDGDVREFGEMHDDAAIVDGYVYVLLFRDGKLHIDELTRDLTPIASSIVPAEGDWHRNATLHSRGDRLVLDVPPAQYEFSADLADVKEVSRVAPPDLRVIGQAWCPEHVRIGAVDAFACWKNRETGETFVAWDCYRDPTTCSSLESAP